VRQRVVALDRRRDDAIDDLRDHGFAGDRGEAVPGDGGIGLDLDETCFERGLSLDAG
jgi:hypothetical protein